jgi:hypothetical protein
VATADTARLIASLELQDKFSKTADAALTKVDRIDKRLGAFSGAVNRNLSRAVDATISRGVRALTGSITEGLGSLAELETATTSVDGAIAASGKTWTTTSADIAASANEIETATQAAFDDKAITNATATLIRYGGVTEDNLKPAMVVMTDLAARTGDVDSAATLLAKALADPTKAAGKLARSGVILTKQQQEQIKAFVEAGEVGKAQEVILESLARTTGGAAATSVGKYGDTLNLMRDASEDAKKALAEGFFPVIQRVSSKITELANDPATISRLRDFGTTLAGAFDKAIDVAEGIDWKSMGDGLKVAYDWSSKLFGAFMSAPAEVKGLIIGLAGLTKLTGGAPIKIAVDFAKDAIGGVFGHFFERGSSPANPMFVSGTGIGGGKDGPGGILGGLKTLITGAMALSIPIAIAAAGGIINKELSSGLAGIIAGSNEKLRGFLEQGFATVGNAMNPIGAFVADLDKNLDNLQHLDRIPGELGKIAAFLSGNVTPKNKPATYQNAFGPAPVNQGGQMKGWAEAQKAWTTTIPQKTEAVGDKVTTMQGVLDPSILATRDAVHATKERVASAVTSGAVSTGFASRAAGSQVTGQVSASGNAIVGAVRASRDIITVHNNVNVSASDVVQQTTTVQRSSQSSSKQNDERHYG